MSRPLLVIITGHPGSGKTALARRLSEQYRLPYISKDALKERIFGGLGFSDKAWSLKVSGVSHRIMDDLVEQALRLSTSVIVESNFKANVDSARFSTIAEQYGADCVQILCTAPGDVLLARWNDRIQHGERHAGHVEAVSLAQIKQDLAKPYQPLNLPGQLFVVDTSDFSKIELPKLAL
jgi:predicted kinase